jgi:hypothetical protein
VDGNHLILSVAENINKANISINNGGVVDVRTPNKGGDNVIRPEGVGNASPSILKAEYFNN